MSARRWQECLSGAAVAMMLGCTAIFIAAEGSQRSLPPNLPKTIVGGNDPPAVQRTIDELARRGFPIVPLETTDQARPDQTQPIATGPEIAALRQLGAQRGAELLVVVSMVSKPMTVWRPAPEEPVQPPARTILESVRLTVTGLDIKTGTVVWHGTAWLRYPVPTRAVVVDSLVARALAAAVTP